MGMDWAVRLLPYTSSKRTTSEYDTMIDYYLEGDIDLSLIPEDAIIDIIDENRVNVRSPDPLPEELCDLQVFPEEPERVWL